MSSVKISGNPFLGQYELERLFRFLQEEGFRQLFKKYSLSFGLIGDREGVTNARVITGSTSGTVKFNEGYLFDSNGNTLYVKSQDNFSIADDGNWHWLRISYRTSPIEVGTVSIDSNGNLTGIGTKFTEVLRGKPDFPSVIKFYDSSLNTIEYEVVEVLNDTSAKLAGDLNAETDLRYSVIGTFDPDSVPASVDKEIFQYDSVEIEDIVETVSNTEPSSTPDLQFYLARVKNNGGTVEIQDKRNDLWKLRGEYKQEFIHRISNPLIGIENIKWQSSYSPGDKNIVELSWGFRSENWTLNNTLNTVTMTGGLGGKYKDIDAVNNGDFDGWRVYVDQSGEYYKVVSSTTSGSQVNLVLDSLDPKKFSESTQIIVVPDVESVIIRAFQSGAKNVEFEREFAVNTDIARFQLTANADLSSFAEFTIQYRHRRMNEYTEWNPLPDDIDNGFYDETSFETTGILKSNPVDRNRKTYEYEGSDYIELIPNPSGYRPTINRIDTGDVLGVNAFALNNDSPVVDLEVGIDKQEQIVYNEETLEFNVDHYLNLKTEGAKAGNFFVFHFKGNFNTTPVGSSGFSLNLTQNYVSAGDPGSIIRTFDREEIKTMNRVDIHKGTHGFLIKVLFDGTNWITQDITRVIGTSNTGTETPIIENNEWSKVAVFALKAENRQIDTFLRIVQGRRKSATAKWIDLNIRLSQSDALGNLPIFYAEAINERNWSRDDIRFVVTQNDGSASIIEMWIKSTSSFNNRRYSINIEHLHYQGINYTGIHKSDLVDASWEFIFNQFETSSSPPVGTGTSFFVDYGIWRSDNFVLNTSLFSNVPEPIAWKETRSFSNGGEREFELKGKVTRNDIGFTPGIAVDLFTSAPSSWFPSTTSFAIGGIPIYSASRGHALLELLTTEEFKLRYISAGDDGIENNDIITLDNVKWRIAGNNL